MNITKKIECSALPKGWQREEVLRKTGLSAGKVDVFYYSPTGGKVETKSKLVRQLGDTVDLTTFDYQSGRQISQGQSCTSQQLQHSQQQHTQHLIFQRPSPSTSLKRCSSEILNATTASVPIKQSYEFSRNLRPDLTLVPPIRQTASIFKQPVTIYKLHETEVKNDIKQGIQDKPKQLFWEKRLEKLHACDVDGSEFGKIELPKGLKPAGPYIDDGTLLQSVATALHVSGQPIIGQTEQKTVFTSNMCAFTNPEQPLMYAVNINDDDIRRQEERVTNARKKLQDALKE